MRLCLLQHCKSLQLDHSLLISYNETTKDTTLTLVEFVLTLANTIPQVQAYTCDGGHVKHIAYDTMLGLVRQTRITMHVLLASMDILLVTQEFYKDYKMAIMIRLTC